MVISVGVRDFFIEREINIAHAGLVPSPNLLENVLPKFAQRLGNHLPRSLKSS